MARASVTYRWPDESALMVEVECDESYPDSIAECKAQAAALMREAWAILPDET